MTPPLEHDYIGLSELPSMDAGEKLAGAEEDKLGDLKKTELRLGLPGSESPERENWNEAMLMLGPPKSGAAAVSGAKRGFSAAIQGGAKQWLLHGGGVRSQTPPNDDEKKGQDSLSSKAQVVGWPPIRSYRKNTLSANAPKNNSAAAEGSKQEVGCIYVKVSMDGAPYLRKVDLKNYCNYEDLSSSLETMFSCFTIGQCGNNGAESGKSGVSKSRLIDLLDGSEYVLTYEDKDGDWMLVGDVPWEMFTATCKRLRIMKGSEAIGLAPRAVEKNKNQN